MFQVATKKALSEREIVSPPFIQLQMKHHFIEVWDEDRRFNRKLSFYNILKSDFEVESYLYEGLQYKDLVSIARLRTSSHKLRVETGRYGANRAKLDKRACPFCTDLDAAEYLSELPYFKPLIEDELQVLRTCPAYHDLWSNLSNSLKTYLFADLAQAFRHTKELGRYVRKIWCRKFPKKKEQSEDKSNEKKSLKETSQKE